MSFIAEFEVDSQALEETTERVPDMVFQTEDIHMTEEGQVKFMFRAHGDDFDELEAALAEDSAVESYAALDDGDDYRSYRVTFTKAANAKTTYPDVAEHGFVLLDITSTHGTTNARARVPSREALKKYREVCDEKGLGFRLIRLYREDGESRANPYGLTAGQKELLATAHERGYFETPREATLEDLAAEFDVTPSALGRRLRRAQDALIERTVQF